MTGNSTSARRSLYDADGSHVYDQITKDDTFELSEIAEIARREGTGPVLDLGCGSGRITLFLARKGHQIKGVDSSPEMIRILDSRINKSSKTIQERVESVLGSMLDPHGQDYRLVILATSNVSLLSGPDRRALLDMIYLSMSPGALFVVTTATYEVSRDSVVQNEHKASIISFSEKSSSDWELIQHIDLAHKRRTVEVCATKPDGAGVTDETFISEVNVVDPGIIHSEAERAGYKTERFEEIARVQVGSSDCSLDQVDTLLTFRK